MLYASTLTVGDWVVARAIHGLLECEYTLFAASDVLLAAPIAGGGVREQGYLTTAGIARARLAKLGLTSELAQEALETIAGDLAGLARAPALASVIGRASPSEAFQGGTYDAELRRYEGAWLDLDAVGSVSELNIAFAMQLVHLAAALAQTREDAPIRLWTGGDDAPVSARSFKRVAVDAADLPRALASLPRPLLTQSAMDADGCKALVRELRVRASVSVAVEARRLYALASAVEQAQAHPARDVAPAAALVVADDVEYEPVPLIDELRSHREMLHGELHLHEVAQFLTAMADRSKTDAAELAILAARAWLASGEAGYARYFARRVLEDAAASTGPRLAATAILGGTHLTQLSMLPPPATTMHAPVVIIADPASSKQARQAPPGASRPPMEAMPPSQHVPRADATRIEVVETMSQPEGDEIRSRMTQLARDLARDYRLSYGTTLKTDVVAIEAMQHHLRRRFEHAQRDARASRQFDEELTRHGALLSEILVRTLGARWVDVSSPELGRWVMVVPPSTRVWPIGRVYRFFEQGDREGDLVSFYLTCGGTR